MHIHIHIHTHTHIYKYIIYMYVGIEMHQKDARRDANSQGGKNMEKHTGVFINGGTPK